MSVISLIKSRLFLNFCISELILLINRTIFYLQYKLDVMDQFCVTSLLYIVTTVHKSLANI